MENKNWTPTQEDNLGIITRVYKSIKEELYELQEKLHVQTHLFTIS